MTPYASHRSGCAPTTTMLALVWASLALAGQSQTRAGVYSGGNFYFELLFLLDSALAAAGFAGAGDHSACAATLMAGAAD